MIEPKAEVMHCAGCYGVDYVGRSCRGRNYVPVRAVADLAARIVAAVEGVEVFELPTGDYVDKDAVLDAIKREIG